MNTEISWGVLGNATIARKCVIPAIFSSKNSRVHALATRHPEQAETVAQKYGIQRVYSQYDAVLADEHVRAVYIPLPNHLHKEWTIRSLKAGKHVLCEKPLACNASEAIEMAEAASRQGVYLMEALMYRFHPRSLHIHRMIRRGEIGALRFVRASFCFHMGEERLKEGKNIRLKKPGGGALLDVGCYGVSVARWLMGEDPEKVHAAARYNTSGADLQIAGVMHFSSGGLATVEAGFDGALQQTYTVVGENASIELPHNAFIPWEKDAEFVIRGRDEEVGHREIIPGDDQYRLMVEHFSEAVINGTPLLVDIEESVQNMRVLDALAESAKTGQAVNLPK